MSNRVTVNAHAIINFRAFYKHINMLFTHENYLLIYLITVSELVQLLHFMLKFDKSYTLLLQTVKSKHNHNYNSSRKIKIKSLSFYGETRIIPLLVEKNWSKCLSSPFLYPLRDNQCSRNSALNFIDRIEIYFIFWDFLLAQLI